MIPKPAIILFLLMGYSCIIAQSNSDWSYKVKWQARPSIGLNFPLKKLFNNSLTDNLIDYHDGTNYYLQVITVSYFFHKHWGVELSYQGSSSNKANGKNRGNRFAEMLLNEYGANYFITPSSGASYGNSNIFEGNVGSGLIGIIYRKEFNRFFVHPKLAFGITSFYTDWGETILKEKNSNNLLKINYSTGKLPNDHFTTATSLVVGYKITEKIFWNIEVSASYFKTDFKYKRKVIDQSTGMISISDFSQYKKDIFMLGIGTGLNVVIK